MPDRSRQKCDDESRDRHGSPHVEQQPGAPANLDDRMRERRHVAGREQDAQLGGSHPEKRQAKGSDAVARQIGFHRHQQVGREQGERDDWRHEPGRGDPEQQHHGAGRIEDVVHVEAVARALLIADARERAVERVAEPVKEQAGVDQVQRWRPAARQHIAERRPGGSRCGESGEMVGIDAARKTRGHPRQRSTFKVCRDAVHHAHGGCESLKHDRLLPDG
jgi:hypothetical protein